MADTEPTKDVTSSSAEIRWPDPTRPIISEQPSQGWGGYPQQPPGSQPPAGNLPPRRPQPPGDQQPYYYPQPPYPEPPNRPRRWPIVTSVLIVLALILVAVWLLWWR